ncbi:MAG TPA: mechanosensitive ion channel family protein [Solirubrobacterales bacterium]|nr:mechanosensitive ion channel family protein [Solirubrobacterales bacterium]
MALKRKSEPDEDEAGQRQLPKWMFETRTADWQEAGLAEEISHGSTPRALLQAVLFGLAFATVLILYDNRQELLGLEQTSLFDRLLTAGLLVIFGWGLARSIGKGLVPALLRRLAPATAGTVGFLIRLAMIAAVGVIALRIAGIKAETLVLGGAFTAVIVGLAAQQTLGNVFAGIVLQGTRPFRVGERVRLFGGTLGGSIEGTVGSLGLFYTGLVNGSDRIAVPNNAIVQAVVMPLHEPDRVDLRARFETHVSPSRLQARLRDGVSVPTRHPPYISVEEIDRDQVVVRITATPSYSWDGAKLAEEILAVTRARLDEEA